MLGGEGWGVATRTRSTSMSPCSLSTEALSPVPPTSMASVWINVFEPPFDPLAAALSLLSLEHMAPPGSAALGRRRQRHDTWNAAIGQERLLAAIGQRQQGVAGDQVRIAFQ